MINCIYLANILSSDWIWVLLVVLLLFGAKKLPELSRSLGKSVSEFKKGMNEAEQPTETKAKENNATDDEKKKNSPVNPT